MKKTFILFIILTFVLAACGKKYDEEITEVSNLEKQHDEQNKNKGEEDRMFKRSNADFKVYEDGKVIVVSDMPSKISDIISDTLYRKNDTTGKYEYDSNVNVYDYQKDNQPDYEENNLKK
ncbi:cystatin-like fold lipoprotein [Staphylococcus pseudintermedius]